MKQAEIYKYDNGVRWHSNYEGDPIAEVYEASRRSKIDEILAEYTLLNKKQNVSREDLM